MSLARRTCGKTDRGRVRTVNQDSILLDEGLGLFAVADGMGGHQAGEVASALALEALQDRMKQRPRGRARPARERLLSAVTDANRVVFGAAQGRAEWGGMGTTVAAVLFAREGAAVAHVGDSRVYLWRGGELSRLTEDHSLAAEQVRQGILSPGDALASSGRHVLTRALGVEPDVDVDIRKVALEKGDVVLICSDGLHGMLPDEHLAAVLSSVRSPHLACRWLVDEANRQ
jgi:protein phosphatase